VRPSIGHDEARGGSPRGPDWFQTWVMPPSTTSSAALTKLLSSEARNRTEVVRVSNEAMASALRLPVEFIEHEVTEQGRKWTSLRSPFHAWADQPVLHHPSIQECSDEFQQPLVE
jgi:hypothetical protein